MHQKIRIAVVPPIAKATILIKEPVEARRPSTRNAAKKIVDKA